MFFQAVEQGMPDAVFGLLNSFKEDPRLSKVNLIAGVYHDENLKTKMMDSVKTAKKAISDTDEIADYLPIEGLESFQHGVGELVFGEKVWAESKESIFAAQTPGGTGALRVGAEFVAQEVTKKVLIPNPTWANHRFIFERAGFKVDLYPYYSAEKKGFDFASFCKFLEKAEENSLVVLHAVCHNPTGCDPSPEEWKKISQIFKRKKLLPFFDFAYQGFGNGVKEDRFALEIFFQEGHEMLIAYSCSKNFSLYCQRVGALFIVNQTPIIKNRVGSQVKRMIRALYSNPPAHGARVVSHILNTPSLRKKWEEDLSEMRTRLSLTRGDLIKNLNEKSGRKTFDFLKPHKGMFSYLGLTKSQVSRMIEEFGVYLLDPGRINIAGLSKSNIDYVTKCLLAVSDVSCTDS